jgi:iron(III) transport system permease protein
VLLWSAALFALGLVALVPLYLVLRVLEADANTLALLVRANTVLVMVRTLALAGTVTAFGTLIAVPLAWLTVRTDMPARGLMSLLCALPLVIPSYIGAYLFVAAFGPRGLLQQLLSPLGILRLPDSRGFLGAAIVLTLYTYPIILLMCQAVLRRGDPSLEAASRSLGHGPWTTFARVTWPRLRAPVAAGGLLVALYTLRDFGAVSVMRVDTFTRVIYVQYQSAFDRASAAALSLVLVALAVGFVTLEVRARGRAPLFRAGPGAARVTTPVALGRWRWPVLAGVSIVPLLSLVAPAAVLAYWLTRGLLVGERIAPLAETTASSLLASTLGAAATLLFAVAIAWLAVRRQSRTSAFVDRFTQLGYALPGIVVALAYVFAQARTAGAQSPWAIGWLVAAYVVLFVPQASGAVRTALLQLKPSLQEAGRALGRGQGTVLRTVTLPLVWPGIGAAAALVFLTAMKELPATLLLSPLGFETLAMQVWSSVTEAYFARAAAPALALVALSSLPLALLLRRVPGESF